MRSVLRIASVLIMGACVVGGSAFAGPVPITGPAVSANAAGMGNGPYAPPACVAGVPFADVTCSTFYDAWIEQFARDGITSGCGNGDYCPNENVTRAQMAVFIEAAMRGTASWPAHTQLVWAVKASDGSPDPVASGTALLNAVAAIPTSGNDAPSATNPWLLKIGPGIFNLNGQQLTLPSYVNLDGAGQDSTTITTATVTEALYATGTNRVSNVTVENTIVQGTTIAVQASGATLTLDRVFVRALHGSSYTVGIYSANSYLYVYDGDVVASGGQGYGIYALSGAPYSVQVWRTLFSCGTADISNFGGQEVDLAFARVPDALANNGGTYKCISNYDFNLAPVACP